MDIYTHIPYTYLIGWSKHNKWYYGVRYAKGCKPEELFVTYFTSSSHVRTFTKENGHPDIIEIRKTFDNQKTARDWEYRVLKRIKVITQDKWLNKCANEFPFNIKDKSYMKSDSYRAAISRANKGKPAWNKNKSNETQKGKKFYNNGINQKMFLPNEVPAGYILGRLNEPWNKNIPHSDITKKKISIAGIKRYKRERSKLT